MAKKKLNDSGIYIVFLFSTYFIAPNDTFSDQQTPNENFKKEKQKCIFAEV